MNFTQISNKTLIININHQLLRHHQGFIKIILDTNATPKSCWIPLSKDI